MAKAPSEFPIIVFADGASSGNPGPGGWGAVITSPDGRVWELGGGSPDTTNNQMELTAVIRALDRITHIGLAGPVDVYTDSVYVIRGITQWSWGWRKNGWKSAEGAEVANVSLWKQLISALAKRDREMKLSWKWVKGHSGVPGNERVDEIAVAFTKGRRPSLYEGPLLGYGVAIHDLPENTELPDLKPKAPPKPAAHSYLSLLGSTPMRHANWADCERRVKGQSGAKFKKAMSEAEEEQILRGWGFKRSDLK